MKGDMHRFNLSIIVSVYLVFIQVCIANDFETGFFTVKDSLKESAPKTKALLKKVTPKVIKFSGGAGAILFKDIVTGVELIATARHLKTKNAGTIPVDDFYWTLHNPSGSDPNLAYAEYGNRSIENYISFKVKPDQFVVALGFPTVNEMSNSIGRILPDGEVRQLQKRQGILETDELAYNPKIERFIEARGYQGMSGGPVFNSNGEWIGTSIRAGEIRRPKPDDWKPGKVYIRFLTAAYMLSTFKIELEKANGDKLKILKRFSKSVEKMNSLSSQSKCEQFY